MDQDTNWIVYQRNDGLWAKKKSGAKIASSIHPSREHAENSARELLKTRGKSKILIEDPDGMIQNKDSFFQLAFQALRSTKKSSS